MPAGGYRYSAVRECRYQDGMYFIRLICSSSLLCYFCPIPVFLVVVFFFAITYRKFFVVNHVSLFVF